MAVHIIQDFYVDADDKQYILTEKKISTKINKETGEKENVEVYRPIGYYGRMALAIEQCINICARRYIAKTELCEANDWLKFYQEITQEINEKFAFEK